MPTWEEHLEFIRSGGDHPVFKNHWYEAWYIIQNEVGMIFLTCLNEIGIFLMPEYQGRGIAWKAIESLMALHPKPCYLANIAPTNHKSIKFFQKHGFKNIQNTYKLEAE